MNFIQIKNNIRDKMKITKEIFTYCRRCNKHTDHKVKLYSKKPAGGLTVGSRRRRRKLKGYIGKVKGAVTPKKVAKRQKVLLECGVCNFKTERILGSRTRKRLEFTVK